MAAASSSIFPAFIRAEYSRGTAFPEFQREAAGAARDASDTMRRQFRASAEDISRTLANAIRSPAGVDLGIQEMRTSAAAADQRAMSLRRVADAANALAGRERSLSAAQQAVIASANASALAAERDAQEQRERLAVYEQIAPAMSRAAGAHRSAGAAVAAATGQARVGALMLGQQIQDVGMQIALGTDPLRVFAMQAGQTAMAVQQMGAGGAAGAVARFLGGPWGAALLAGGSILAMFATRASEAEAAQLNLADAADTLGRAQSLLGNFLDLTTGRQINQNEAMREAIRLTAVLAQLEAARAGREAGARLSAMRPFTRLDAQGRPMSSGQQALEAGNAIDNPFYRPPRDNPGVAAFEQLVRNFRANAGASIAEFRRSLEGLQASGQLRGLDINAAMREAITVATNRNEIATMRDVQRVAEGGPLPSYLRRPSTGGRRGGGGRQAPDETEFGEDAGNRIANIVGRFTDAPPQVEAVRRAMAELDDVASDLERRRPPNYAGLQQQLEAARATVQDGLLAPYREFLDQERRSLDIQRLINAGRQEEAETVQAIARVEEQTGKLNEAQRETIARRVELRLAEARAAEIEQQNQQRYRQALEQVRQGMESAIVGLETRGLRSIGDFASGVHDAYRQLSAGALIEGLFGDTFRQIEDYVSGRGRLREATDRQAGSSTTAAAALDRLAKAADRAADEVTGAANDNGESEEIVVTGTRLTKDQGAPSLYDLSPREFLQRLSTGIIGRALGDSPDNVRLAKNIGAAVATAMQGASWGNIGAGTILGRSSTSSAIGGAIGGVAGEQIGKMLGSQLGQLAGFAGPIGSIVGGIGGQLLGKLITGTPKASTTIVGADGRLQIAGTTGTRSLRGQSVTAADSVIGSLERIAELFGGSVNSGVGRVSIGMRDGSYRVDPSGRGQTKTKKGAIDFGEDAEAAVRFAVLDMIQDGVLAGLRAGTARLLQSAKDIDSGIEKALKFESVFSDLKRHIDPVGAALDELDKRFASLKRVFEEAGASAEDYAALEQLYGLERKAAIEQAGQAMTSALKGLLDDLTVNNEALSLRERLSQARAKYDPLAARVSAGDRTVDYDAFAEAARMVNELQRQISGSTQPYFEVLETITGLTRKALDARTSEIDVAAGRAPLMGPSDQGAPVVGAIDRMAGTLAGLLEDQIGVLTAANDNLGALIRRAVASGGGATRAGDFPDPSVHNF